MINKNERILHFLLAVFWLLCFVSNLCAQETTFYVVVKGVSDVIPVTNATAPPPKEKPEPPVNPTTTSTSTTGGTDGTLTTGGTDGSLTTGGTDGSLTTGGTDGSLTTGTDGYSNTGTTGEGTTAGWGATTGGEAPTPPPNPSPTHPKFTINLRLSCIEPSRVYEPNRAIQINAEANDVAGIFSNQMVDFVIGLDDGGGQLLQQYVGLKVSFPLHAFIQSGRAIKARLVGPSEASGALGIVAQEGHSILQSNGSAISHENLDCPGKFGVGHENSYSCESLNYHTIKSGSWMASPLDAVDALNVYRSCFLNRALYLWEYAIGSGGDGLYCLYTDWFEKPDYSKFFTGEYLTLERGSVTVGVDKTMLKGGYQSPIEAEATRNGGTVSIKISNFKIYDDYLLPNGPIRSEGDASDDNWNGTIATGVGAQMFGSGQFRNANVYIKHMVFSAARRSLDILAYAYLNNQTNLGTCSSYSGLGY